VPTRPDGLKGSAEGRQSRHDLSRRAALLLSPTPLVWHNGGPIGSKAVVGFTPEGDLGLVVLSNLDGTDLPEALMYSLYDLYHAAREGLYRRLPRRCPRRGA
jgi:hypothetical protein